VAPPESTQTGPPVCSTPMAGYVLWRFPAIGRHRSDRCKRVNAAIGSDGVNVARRDLRIDRLYARRNSSHRPAYRTHRRSSDRDGRRFDIPRTLRSGFLYGNPAHAGAISAAAGPKGRNWSTVVTLPFSIGPIWAARSGSPCDRRSAAQSCPDTRITGEGGGEGRVLITQCQKIVVANPKVRRRQGRISTHPTKYGGRASRLPIRNSPAGCRSKREGGNAGEFVRLVFAPQVA